MFWKIHTSNAELYGELSMVISKVLQKRMCPAGHCIMYDDDDEVATNLVTMAAKRKMTHIHRHTARRHPRDRDSTRAKGYHVDSSEWKKPIDTMVYPGR